MGATGGQAPGRARGMRAMMVTALAQLSRHVKGSGAGLAAKHHRVL